MQGYRVYLSLIQICRLLSPGVVFGWMAGWTADKTGDQHIIAITECLALIGIVSMWVFGVLWAGLTAAQAKKSLTIATYGGAVMSVTFFTLLIMHQIQKGQTDPCPAVEQLLLALVGCSMSGPMLAGIFLSHPKRMLANARDILLASTVHLATPGLVATFAIANLDQFSWGTRESRADRTAHDLESGVAEAAAAEMELAAGFSPVIYDRNHFHLTANDFALRRCAARRAKWRYLLFFLLANTTVAASVRYGPLSHSDFLGFKAEHAMLFLAAVVALVAFGEVLSGKGGARTPLGMCRSPYSHYPPHIDLLKLPLPKTIQSAAV